MCEASVNSGQNRIAAIASLDSHDESGQNRTISVQSSRSGQYASMLALHLADMHAASKSTLALENGKNCMVPGL